MDKQSTMKVARILADTQSAITSLVQERDELQAKVAAYKRREEATKVAAMLHDKNVHRDIEFQDLVEKLEKEAEAGHLPEIQRAADMIGPNMIFGTTTQGHSGEQNGDALTSYLMGFVS
jgi:chorismate mutase